MENCNRRYRSKHKQYLGVNISNRNACDPYYLQLHVVKEFLHLLVVKAPVATFVHVIDVAPIWRFEELHIGDISRPKTQLGALKIHYLHQNVLKRINLPDTWVQTLCSFAVDNTPAIVPEMSPISLNLIKSIAKLEANII